MSLVLQHGMTGEHENLPHCILNPLLCSLIICGTVPDGDDVFVVADGEDSPTNLVTQLELFVGEEGDDEVFPEAGGQAFAETDHPLAATSVGRILPDRLDSLTEDVEISVHGQLSGPLHMIVDCPKLFSLSSL